MAQDQVDAANKQAAQASAAQAAALQQAAQANARAAELGLKWQERQAGREVAEARRSLETAQARIAFAQEAVAASENFPSA